MNRRKLDVLVLSDIHLGTFGCNAKALVHYLRSVEPKILVLNGDILDIWLFRKSFFPKTHLAAVSEMFKMASWGIPVYYLTGNHDDDLRKFAPLKMGNIFLDNKLVLEIDGKKAWIFHGDVYDGSITHGRFVAIVGGACYDFLVLFNRLVNRVLRFFYLPQTYFSKAIKSKVKSTVQKVSDFEKTAINTAIENGYDYVICGHIHRPQMREASNKEGTGKVIYLNSGDWMENLTSLEYYDGKWHIYKYDAEEFKEAAPIPDVNIKLDKLIELIQDGTIQETL